jgi:hypothetical protein
VSILTTSLEQFFCMKVKRDRFFLLLQFRLVIFGQKDIGRKAALKILVKFTTAGWNNLDSPEGKLFDLEQLNC